MHLFTINGNVLADDVDDFLLQLRQVVGLSALPTLVGDDDLQTFLGNRRGRRFLAVTEIIENAHLTPSEQALQQPLLLCFEEAVRNVLAQQTLYGVAVSLTGIALVVHDDRDALVGSL